MSDVERRGGLSYKPNLVCKLKSGNRPREPERGMHTCERSKKCLCVHVCFGVCTSMNACTRVCVSYMCACARMSVCVCVTRNTRRCE